MLPPSEASAVDDRAAECCAMSSKKFRQRMDDNVGAVVEWFEKNRRGHRIVDYQRNALTMGHFSERFNVADIAGRISDRFAKYRLCVFINQSFNHIRLVTFSKSARNPLAWQYVGKQSMRCPIQLRDRYNVAPAVG